MSWVICVPFLTFAQAPQSDNPAAQGMEGFNLFSRDSLPDDRDRGFALMMSAAWEGDAKSANNVGWLMEHGEYAERDVKGALRWYERAADQRLPAAALNYVSLLLNDKEGALGNALPDQKRVAKAASLAGRAMLIGRGLPYDGRRGEEMLLRGALMGDSEAAETIAQQLELYPDSFSYLDLEKIAAECDALLPPEHRNIQPGIAPSEFVSQLLTPQFWYQRIGSRHPADMRH